MSRFRIPGGIGYQGHYPLGSIEDGTLVRTNSNAPSSFQTSVANAWDDLGYEAKAKIASAGVDVNRLMSVVKAVNRSRAKVVPMLVAELGVRVEELVAGVIPGLLIMLCCVVSTTALGAAAGGALGSFLGGVGAAPGAVLGGTLGFEAGIALLTWLGLAFLVSHVAKDLGIAIDKAIAGLQTAWDAGKQSGAAGDLRIDFAATQLASAVVHLFLSIVNALIAYITKGAATSSVNNVKVAVSEAALAEAIVKINKSKILGKTVGVWFQKNYQAIIEFRSRKTARPSDSPRPLEPAMTPSQIKKIKEESGYRTSENSDGANSGRSVGAAEAIGLETRGLIPAVGTRQIPEGIPDTWRIRATQGEGGVLYYNPKNPNENIRVMQGNPNSPYVNSQGPYARQQNSAGTYLREDGSPSPLPRGGRYDSDAHIPLQRFKVR
jgi:hypothetical protein